MSIAYRSDKPPTNLLFRPKTGFRAGLGLKILQFLPGVGRQKIL